MIQALQIIYLLILLCAAIVAFYNYGSLKTRRIGILAPFIAYIFIQELTLILLDRFQVTKTNAIVYHAYRVLNVVVFAIIYSRITFMAPYRKLIISLAALFTVATIIQVVSAEAYLIPLRYLPLIRGLVITIYGMLFLFKYFRLDNRKEEKYWIPLLWITIGLVIFYPVISISLAFQTELKSFGDVYGIRLYQIIPQFVSLFMYSCFIYAFRLCKLKD